MIHKSYDATVKTTDAPGRIEAIFSTNSVDKVGDRVQPTAFTKSIERFKATGKKLPLIWSHQWSDPFSIIGEIDPADITTGKSDVSMGANIDTSTAMGQRVYDLMRKGLVGEFSIGGFEKNGFKAKDGAFEITEFDLVEVSVCLRGINQETELLSIKSANERDVLRARAARVKAYANIEIEGTYEERQEDLQEALEAANPAPDGTSYWGVSIIATTDSDVIYQMYGDGAEGGAYRVAYTVADDGSLSLGSPEPVAFQPVPDTDEAAEEKSEPEPDVVTPAPVVPAAHKAATVEDAIFELRREVNRQTIAVQLGAFTSEVGEFDQATFDVNQQLADLRTIAES